MLSKTGQIFSKWFVTIFLISVIQLSLFCKNIQNTLKSISTRCLSEYEADMSIFYRTVPYCMLQAFTRTDGGLNSLSHTHTYIYKHTPSPDVFFQSAVQTSGGHEQLCLSWTHRPSIICICPITWARCCQSLQSDCHDSQFQEVWSFTVLISPKRQLCCTLVNETGHGTIRWQTGENK